MEVDSPQAPPIIATTRISPHIKVQIYLSKKHRPIQAIAFLDTGAAESLINPAMIPPSFLVPEVNTYKAASSKIFSTYLRTKPLTIMIFPTCTISSAIVATDLPGKDLVLGWDFCAGPFP
ncbi:hypothetical protein MLD38_011484 [Melastoma candidum]|uniref:Uncharacterized protein n=1 Tax=Melastoma candidum TaxID=119954 RepID=A0ACB9R2M8_9MYRT|nr:hypothetical protein MLD38_011484 [Melastoma candidum]